METKIQAKKESVMHFAHWSRSGITSVIRSICNEFEHSFVLLLSDPDFGGYYQGIRHKLSMGLDSRFAGSGILRFLRFYRKLRPDIVHAHSFTPLLIAAALCWKSKLVFHVHNEYPYFSEKDWKSRTKRALIKFVYKLREVHSVAVSATAASELELITKRECAVLPNGIQDDGATRASFVEEKAKARFYSLCRLSEQKNLPYGVSLVAAFKRSNPELDISYDIFGDGAEYNRIQNRIIEEDCADIVSLKGFIEDPYGLPEKYDYYISTSIYEGFGLSSLNALRGGNILILTPVGELASHLVDGNNCFFIANELNTDLHVLSAATRASSERLAKMQLAGRDLFLSNFEITEFFRGLERFYSKLS